MEILLTITGLFIAIIALPWLRHEILDDMALWAYLIYCGLPALNLVPLALTFRKEKENTPPEYLPREKYEDEVECLLSLWGLTPFSGRGCLIL